MRHINKTIRWLLLAATLPMPLAAQEAPKAPDLAPDKRIAVAGALGQLLFAYDRAAWVSTDAVKAQVPESELTGLGGYVVEGSDLRSLHVTYYRDKATEGRAFFVADVEKGKVTRAERLLVPVPLTRRQMMLAHARDIAAQTAVARGFKPCTPAPFNTVVVAPMVDGPTLVYLLSAQVDAKTYPMGGHFRVVVESDGRVTATRPYSVKCRNIPVPAAPAGGKPVGLVINSLLDIIPTELDVFASYSLRLPIYVSTQDDRQWRVTGGEIVENKAKQ